MRRQILGRLFICTGVLLLLAAGVLYAIGWRESNIAGANSEKLLQELSHSILQAKKEQEFDTVPQEVPVGEMPSVVLSGYDLAGIIRMQDVSVELPVLNTWSYDLLKIAPCRYSGSLSGGDLILLGHNYTTHFAALRKLKPGALVEFCDVNGTWYRFTVSSTETLKATELEKLTSTKSPLTIFTCTRDGLSRFVLRCDYAE